MPPNRIHHRQALLCTVALGAVAAVQFLAIQTTTGQFIDDRLMQVVRTSSGAVGALATASLSSVSPPLILLVLVLIGVVGVFTRRISAVVRAVIVCVGANITTQVLKHAIVERPLLSDVVASTPNSFPSGHATLAISVVAAVLIILPTSAALIVALPAALWAGAVALGTIAAGWHRPSDIVGAVLIVFAWDQATRFGAALLSNRGRVREPRSAVASSTP